MLQPFWVCYFFYCLCGISCQTYGVPFWRAFLINWFIYFHFDSLGILWLAGVLDSDESMLKPSLVCLEMGFRQASIMHGHVAEIIHPGITLHLRTEYYLRSLNEQKSSKSLESIALVYKCSRVYHFIYIIVSFGNWFVLRILTYKQILTFMLSSWVLYSTSL